MPESPFRRRWHAGVAISATLACRSRHFGDFGMPESPFRRLWHAEVAEVGGRRSAVAGLRSAVGIPLCLLTYILTLLTYLTYLPYLLYLPGQKEHYKLIDCPKGKSNESPSLRASETPRLRGSETPSCRTTDDGRQSAVGSRRAAVGNRQSAVPLCLLYFTLLYLLYLLATRRSAIGSRRSAVGCRRLVVGCRRSSLVACCSSFVARGSLFVVSAVGGRLSVVWSRSHDARKRSADFGTVMSPHTSRRIVWRRFGAEMCPLWVGLALCIDGQTS